MRQSLKKIIDREIIILGSIAFIIGLIWIIFLTVDYFKIRKCEDLQYQISNLLRRIETLRSPHTFQDIVTNRAPDEFIKQGKWDEYLISVDSANIADQRNINIFQLYVFLNLTRFSYSTDSVVPDFLDFKSEIEKELSTEVTEKIHIDKIYGFLKGQRYLTIDEKEFISVLDYYSLLPDNQLMDVLTNKMGDLKNELAEVNNNGQVSTNKGTIIGWISLILLIAAYPIRFIFFKLIWAIKALIQK